MSPSKLKLDDVEVESFETAAMAETMEAHMLATLRGETIMCTNCGNKLCAA